MKNKKDFYIKTFANFIECDIPKRDADFISKTGDGEVPSKYWFEDNCVIRHADHWGKAQECIWLLNGLVLNELKTGACEFKNFHDIDYIEIHYVKQSFRSSYKNIYTKFASYSHILEDFIINQNQFYENNAIKITDSNNAIHLMTKHRIDDKLFNDILDYFRKETDNFFVEQKRNQEKNDLRLIKNQKIESIIVKNINKNVFVYYYDNFDYNSSYTIISDIEFQKLEKHIQEQLLFNTNDDCFKFNKLRLKDIDFNGCEIFRILLDNTLILNHFFLENEIILL